jgi:hypothetical protein
MLNYRHLTCSTRIPSPPIAPALPPNGGEPPRDKRKRRFATAFEYDDPNRLIGKFEFSEICSWKCEGGSTPTLNRRMKNDPNFPKPMREWPGGPCKWLRSQAIHYRNHIYNIPV